MALTVGDIANRVLGPGAEKTAHAAFVERLRHWTREGLLAPIGEKSPAKGVIGSTTTVQFSWLRCSMCWRTAA